MESTIQDLGTDVSAHYFGISLDEPIESAFPRLHGEGMGSGFAQPMRCVNSALSWLWLRFHQDHVGSISEIKAVIARVAERSLSLHRLVQSKYLRQDHDSFLLHCAILAGDEIVARRVAESVWIADPSLEGYQYVQAWNGVLANSVLGRPEQALEQAQILLKFRPARQYPWPSEKLIRAFLSRDIKSLNSILKSKYKKEWERMRKEDAVVSETAGSITLDFRFRSQNFFWPWVEAVLARLAVMEGAAITFDPLWIPEGLIVGSVPARA